MIKTVQRVMFKNLTLFINILIALAVVVCATFFLQYDVYEHDDFLQSFFFTHSIKELLLTAEHGRYLSWFVMKFIDKNKYDERIQKDGLYFSKEEMKIQKFTNLYKQSFVFEFPNR